MEAGGKGLAWPNSERMFISQALWTLGLAPVVSLLLPPPQAAELQAVAAGNWAEVRIPNEQVISVVSLLGHVVVPGAPGCSYPGCTNLNGRSEAELPLQVCSKCRGARYCCREHQVAHWKAGHKGQCQAAQAAAQQVCSKAAP